MTEDPLERIEREEKQKKNQNLKAAVWVLGAICAALIGILGFLQYKQASVRKLIKTDSDSVSTSGSFYALVEELNDEKQDLIKQMEDLQKDYESLSSDYDNINSQLDTSRAEVAQLIEKIKSTDATNRTKMRQYEKELGTLRSIMRNYISQIDSLNTLNHKLTADVAAARKEAEESKKVNEELTQQVESLAGQVAAGSVLKARGITINAYNSADKITDRSSRVIRLMTSLSLVENDLAPKGPVRVYIRVKDPDGIILTNSVRTSFTFAGETMVASASREVDYEGHEVDLSIYLNEIESYVKGIYTVDVYTEQAFLGSAELMLR
ncbi:MAG: hypothetical protein IJL91_00640 [Bacteroidales bacterium]|nr:hypothetical protein [Bacteroidales bacterium]MBQ6576242.1 hypothetical protein [Bacteroidales bacterium]